MDKNAKLDRELERYEDLDKYYLENLDKIRNSTILKLKEVRENIIMSYQRINFLIQTRKYKPTKLSFMKGRRKMITYLSGDSKRQLKCLNIQLNNINTSQKEI